MVGGNPGVRWWRSRDAAGAAARRMAHRHLFGAERLGPHGLAITRRALVSGERRRIGAGTSTWPGAPPVFVLGCGRSGTSFLGHALGAHPTVEFWFEPHAVWVAIDPRTDSSGWFGGGGATRLWGEDVDDRIRRRFRRAFAPSAGFTMVEKTPINTFRIGYLEALHPAARYVHIVRDGVEVAASIDRVAGRTVRMPGHARAFDAWWGAGDKRWRDLAAIGRESYPQEEVDALEGNRGRGAYEWMLSVREVDAWRPALGGRLLDVTYAGLLDDPSAELARVAHHAGLRAEPEWLERMAARTRARSRRIHELELPPAICDAFNRLQERGGFPGRARPSG